MLKIVINCYETKKYAKGIQTADQILKKYPNSGETLAMKGLISNCMGQKEEAYKLVKMGISFEVRSHTCWHVFGLLHRSDNNYKEASKCYLNALRIDSTNANIMRDLSWLQIQMRDFLPFIESRRQIVNSKAERTNWTAYAVACYLGGEYKMAAFAVQQYFDRHFQSAENIIYEVSEFLLFQNKCLEKQGLFDEALSHLEKQKALIVDKLAIKIKKAELMVKLGRFEEANQLWLDLVNDQSENYSFHCGLQTSYLELDCATAEEMFLLKRLDLPCTSLNLTTEQFDILNKLYDSHEIFKNSRASKKIRLSLVQGESLRTLLDTYLRENLHKGVPSLYQDITALIRQQDPFNSNRNIYVTNEFDFGRHNITVMTLELIELYIKGLNTNGTFDIAPEEDKEVEVPTALLWTLFLKSHLLEMSGNLSDALDTINQCIEHTPTALDMYAKKSNLLSKSGDSWSAADCMDSCRELDLQDRYLNNEATKYLLKANRIPQAKETIALFVKDDGDTEFTLNYLQCNWYELELAESFARLKQWGPALKKFHAIQKHFIDYGQDMFDFHSFCNKKATLRAYVGILSMIDSSFSHPFFQRAAQGTLTILLHLVDHPEDIDGLGHLSSAERKKERARQKKIKDKRDKSIADGTIVIDEDVKDKDVNGDSYLNKNFLNESYIWCNQLSSRVTLCTPETLVLLCDVMIRKGKYLQACRALKCGLNVNPNHPLLTVQLVKFAMRIKGYTGVSIAVSIKNKEISKVILIELKIMMNGLEIKEFAENYMNMVSNSPVTSIVTSLEHRVAAARLMNMVDKVNGKNLAKDLLVSASVWDRRGISIETVIAAWKVFILYIYIILLLFNLHYFIFSFYL
jgi:peptide alpha-N-acetyltransferase